MSDMEDASRSTLLDRIDAWRLAHEASERRAEAAEAREVAHRVHRERLEQAEAERDELRARIAGDLSEGALLNDLANLRRVLQNVMRDTCGPDHEHCTSCYEAEEALGMRNRWVKAR